MKVRRLGYALGAEVTGVDLARVDDAALDAIRKARMEHIVLSFPDQRLDDRQFRDFCALFGELDQNKSTANRHPEIPEALFLANKPITLGGRSVGGNPPADRWHSDGSFAERPTRFTFLLARELPEIGGNTLFANMYMAYDNLSAGFKKLVEGLVAIHDFSLGPTYRNKSGPELDAVRAASPPVAQPVVLVHPETGKKALYVGDRIRNFAGMTEEESEPLKRFLLEHSTRYEFVYRHRWRTDELLTWDNCCTIHLAVQDYDHSLLRRMIRCSTAGAKTGEMAAANA